MSYGAEPDGDDGEDRGLLFTAFNASLGEQYEVVQRWLSGGNSTGASSGKSCPFVGVPDNGVPRYFAFEYSADNGADRVVRMPLEPQTPLFEPPQPFTELQWGMYLFTPSVAVIRRLAARAATPEIPAPWQVARGRQLIVSLKALQSQRGDGAAIDAWKTVIEDPEAIDRLDSASVWAAIRADHAGVLKTPYGSLVASPELLSQVLRDTERRYSVCGQLGRMKRSFGEVFLGMDDGASYRLQAKPVIDEIQSLDSEAVFTLASRAVERKINEIVREATDQARKAMDSRFEVGFDAREVIDEVLADLSEAWFGLNDCPGGRHFVRGSANWNWKPGEPPPYPGHYTALSRYMFQPHPGRTVVELAESYGQALRVAMRSFVQDHRARGSLPQKPDGSGPAPVAKAVFEHPTHGGDDDFVARTIVGVLMGFTPTIIGAVLNVLREWHRAGQFGAMRSDLQGQADFVSAMKLLGSHMIAATRMRPMPQIIWRTALSAHRLGPDGPEAVDLTAGEVVVLALVSGTQEALATGATDDGRLMFGGLRDDKVNAPPVHACPGYHAGIAAMLGALSGLLVRPETLRETSAPFSFVLEGAVEPEEELEESVEQEDESAAPVEVVTEQVTALEEIVVTENVAAVTMMATRFRALRFERSVRDMTRSELAVATTSMGLETAPSSCAVSVTCFAPVSGGGDKGFGEDDSGEKAIVKGKGMRKTVFACGDSWLDVQRFFFDIVGPDDLRVCLKAKHDVIDSWGGVEFCDFENWGTLAALAEKAEVLSEAVAQALKSAKPPQLILLSAGGQDSKEDALETLLRSAGDPLGVLDDDAVKLHVEGLRAHYETVLDALQSKLKGKVPPVLVHGYDYPIPKKRFLRDYDADWLKTPFKNKGHPTDGKAQGVAAKAMRELIDALNEMLSQLPTRYSFVKHVDLRGMLEANWAQDPTKAWWDDLHPVTAGFTLLTDKFDAAIQALP